MCTCISLCVCVCVYVNVAVCVCVMSIVNARVLMLRSVQRSLSVCWLEFSCARICCKVFKWHHHLQSQSRTMDQSVADGLWQYFLSLFGLPELSPLFLTQIWSNISQLMDLSLCARVHCVV